MRRLAKAKKKTARAKGPLLALGWNRAYYHPKTSKELTGVWALPNTDAIRRAVKTTAEHTAIDAQKRVFRDTPIGLKSARKAGLL